MFWKKSKPAVDETNKDEAFYRAGQWQLVWWKFRRHKLAQVAMVVLGIFYFIAIFAEIVTPYDPLHRMREYSAMPPTVIHIRDAQGSFHLPFVYRPVQARDPETLRPIYKDDTTKIYPVKLFVQGDPYKMWNLIPLNLHLFGTDPQPENKVISVFLLGSDSLGRDVLSRIFFGGRISLTVGLIGIVISFIFGLLLGGVAGFFGGLADEVIMRVIDMLVSLPQIPLWMSLAAALPQDWPQIKTYFFVTVILSIFGWASLARTVRGKLLSLREEDYVMSAKLDGESEGAIITRYMLPGFLSYIIVSLTLSIPGMILGETASQDPGS